MPPGALVELVLSGSLHDGTAFTARDCVRLVPPGAPQGHLTVSTVRGGWVQLAPLDLALDGGGFGTFERDYPQGTLVTLEAFEVPGAPFVAWKVDGVLQKLGQRTLQHHVRALRRTCWRSTAQARAALKGAPRRPEDTESRGDRGNRSQGSSIQGRPEVPPLFSRLPSASLRVLRSPRCVFSPSATFVSAPRAHGRNVARTPPEIRVEMSARTPGSARPPGAAM